MTPEEAVLAVIDALESTGVPYMLVGSFSSNYYGVARSTQDADFVIQLGSESILSIGARLEAEFRLDPQMEFETVTGTTRHTLEARKGAFKVELFHLAGDSHDQERFRRRRRVTILGREVSLPTPEDVIVTKLRWSRHGQRPKDIDDVRNVIAVQGDRIDWDDVHSWCEQHGTRELLDEIRQSIPPV